MTSKPHEALSRLSLNSWDVIVIGAGPAGAVAARQAALCGLKTLLIDARTFPREKVCGGYLSNRALSALRQIGLTSAFVESSSSPVREVEMVVGRRRVCFRLPAGRIVCRTSFDAALVKSAQSAGAIFLDGTQAVVKPIVRDSARFVAAIRQGNRNSLRGRIIICADGLARSSVRHLPEFAAEVTPNSRVGMGTVAAGSMECCPSGQIKMVVSQHGYVGISRISKNELNVAAAVDPVILSQASPSQIVTNILTNARVHVPPGLSTATWRGTPPLTNRPMRVAGERLFIIGDAGGYVEPFTGEGMASAFESAVAVVPLAKRATENWESSLIIQWESLHAQIAQNRQFTCRQLAWVLRRPWAAFTAIHACRLVPWFANRVIAKINLPTSAFSPEEMGTT